MSSSGFRNRGGDSPSSREDGSAIASFEGSPHQPSTINLDGLFDQYRSKLPSSPNPRKLAMSIPRPDQQMEPSSAKRKRKPTAAGQSTSPVKKAKGVSSSYAPPTKYAHLVNKLTDSLAPNLICVFIGLNPGLRTATTGHAYNHPSNLFWKLLHKSKCTPRLCRAEEDGDMPKLYNLGLTNIVGRPTKDGSELSKAEMDAGVADLEAKVALQRPEAVAIVGKSIWESIWRVRHGTNIKKDQFKYGWQDDTERMGVVKTTVGMRLHEKEQIWKELGDWVTERRAERNDEEAAPSS